MSDFVLNVLDIDEQGKEHSFTLAHAWVGHELADTDVRPDESAPEGHLSFRAHKQGADLVIHGRVRAELKTECARCLGDAPVHVDAPFSLLMTARSAQLRPEPDELELTPEDLDREFFSGDRVVLDPIVREHLLLEVPAKPLCREDCPGIAVPASVAGPRDLSRDTEGGVDPRLAPLMNLVGKLDPTEE